ncbi:MAG: tetratricopeptide repeat protein [Syntrophobacteraceae bacterium]
MTEKAPDKRGDFPRRRVIASCLLLVAGAMVSWVLLPLEGRVSGMRLALWGPWFGRQLPHATLFSFGGLCLFTALLLILISLSPWRNHPFPWLVAAIGASFIVICFVLRMAGRLDDLTYLWDQYRQMQGVVSFTARYADFSPQVITAGNYTDLNLQFLSLPARIFYDVDFMSWGQVFASIAAGLILSVFFSLVSYGRRVWWSTALTAGLCVSVLLGGWGFVMRDRLIQRAGGAIAGGHYARAEQILTDLGKRYPDVWGWAPYALLVGEADQCLHRDTPALHFYRAAGLTQMFIDHPSAKTNSDAISRMRSEWLAAANAREPQLRRLSRDLMSWSFVVQGLQAYKVQMPDVAITDWELAENFSPRRLDVPIYLAQAQLDLHLCSDSASGLESVLQRYRTQPFLSVAYAILGDANYQMNRIEEARRDYERSIKAYHHYNFRPENGLSGQ